MLHRYSAAFLLLGLAAAAQTAPRTVDVVVTVLRRPDGVGILQASDLKVQVGKKPAGIADWRLDPRPLQLWVAIDDDTTVDFSRRLDAVKTFVQGLPDGSQVGLAYLAVAGVTVLAPLSADRAAALAALRAPVGQSGMSPNPYESLASLISTWPAAQAGKIGARREIYVFSDGNVHEGGDNNVKNPALQKTLAQAQQAGVVIWGMSVRGAGDAMGFDEGPENQPNLRMQGSGNTAAAPKNAQPAANTSKTAVFAPIDNNGARQTRNTNTMNSPASTPRMQTMAGQGNLRALTEGTGGVWALQAGVMLHVGDILQGTLTRLDEHQFRLQLAVPASLTAGPQPLAIVAPTGTRLAAPAMVWVP